MFQHFKVKIGKDIERWLLLLALNVKFVINILDNSNVFTLIAFNYNNNINNLKN